MEAAWKYVTNITTSSQEELDLAVKRMLSKLQNIGKAALPQNKLWEYNKLLVYRKTAYNLAQVCLDEGLCMSLEPDLKELMGSARDRKELLWAWEGWWDAVGGQLRPVFGHYMQLRIRAVQLNGYKDMGPLWRAKYKSDTLEQDLEQLYQELWPLYLNLHAYVHRALYRHYGPQLINVQGPVPAHLLGNIRAQSWVNILDLALPFPKKPPEDITKITKGQHRKSEKIFGEAEKYFTSLGLLPSPPDFWKKSVTEMPVDGWEVECQTSAWDFYSGTDFRVKKCTEMTIEDLLSAFHEMGHIQYFLQYHNLSIIFHEGANPAFEEDVGSVATLSASSYKNLLDSDLLSRHHQDSEEEVNFLIGIALRITFIPFSYLMDMFRWKVFDGSILKGVYNQWWNLRLKYQGLCPAVPRSEDDFVPGAEYHIPANVPNVRYFLSLVLQFQFYEVLCNQASGHVAPLHQCHIRNSEVAGKILGDVMKLGSSRPWPEVLKELAGQSTMSPTALMTYFKPLLNWLVLKVPDAALAKTTARDYPDSLASSHTTQLDSRLVSEKRVSILPAGFHELERSMNSVVFLGLKLEPDKDIFGQWMLMGLSFFMLLVILGLSYRLCVLEKQSMDKDGMILNTLPYTFFLGVAMEPPPPPRLPKDSGSSWVFASS
ncbi:LOW QUALITY PROTEIN: angiotensin-converting enzyme-like protein Ace3 [Ctenodactylus gundi]